MLKIAGSLHRPVVVIGQSLGGVVCHELGMMYGWNIKKSITMDLHTTEAHFFGLFNPLYPTRSQNIYNQVHLFFQAFRSTGRFGLTKQRYLMMYTIASLSTTIGLCSSTPGCSQRLRN